MSQSEKGKHEISTSEATVNFLGAHRQLNVPQWFKGRVEVAEAPSVRMPYPRDSPDMSPCDFWAFGMVKAILKDREFSSSDEIEEAIPQV
jgi:hypothetical protein